MNVQIVLGIFCVLLLIAGVGLWSGRKVRNEKDFITGGGRAGTGLVFGALMGSLVSSQATMGSVQLAFHYGLAAWWFTLGSGIGCLLLALGYVRALRASGCVTVMQIIAGEYGTTAERLGAVLSAAGIFITVLAQVIACIGLITLMFPALSPLQAAMVSTAMMCCYILFGGAWGAGMGGTVKTGLLCLSLFGGMVMVFRLEGGISPLMNSLKGLLAATPLGTVQSAAAGVPDITDFSGISSRFLSLTARGAAKNAASCLSLVLGVISTQTYAQAVWSARSDTDARRGALLSAFLIPPLGIAGIFIGLFMRAHYITGAEVAALKAAGLVVPDLPVLNSTLHALPAFLVDRLPPLWAGAGLGTLLIAVVGGGAGLALGMATVLVKDLRLRAVKHTGAAQELRALRWAVAAVLIGAAVMAVALPDAMLNDFGFLSMGLRGTAVCAPMTCALVLKGRLRPSFIVASMTLGTAAVAAGRFLDRDSLMSGMAVSVLCCLAGLLFPPDGKTLLSSRRKS